MTENMAPQVPDAAKRFALMNVETAEKMFQTFFDVAHRSMDVVRQPNIAGSTTAMPKMSFDFIETNLWATFEHARKLIQAKDLEEIVKLQTDFLNHQFAAAQERMKQFANYAAAETRELEKTLPDAVGSHSSH